MSILPNQRVSDKERSNPEWYINTTDYIINKALTLNAESKKECASNLLAAEGIIDTNTFNYVLKAYGVDDGQVDIPNEVRSTSLILPIKRRYIGEFIRQYKNFQVYHKDVSAIKQRNAKLAVELEQLIAQDLVNFLNEQNLTSGAESKPDVDIKKFIEEFESNWFDDKVIESENIIKLFDSITDAELLYIKAFYYYWATDEVYSYRRVVGENVIKEIVNPLEYHRIPSGNMFAEDDDMGMRKYQISFNQINEQFSGKLSKSDIEYLRSLENYMNTNIKETNILGDRLIEFNKSRDEFQYFSKLDEFNTNANSSNDLSSFCWIQHCVFKSEQKIGYLTYVDQFGNIQEKVIVDGSYKLRPEAGDLKIEYDWISRFYQSWRIGPEHTGIYIKPELIEPQRQDINSINKCKSPYNGITGTFDFNIRNSIAKVLKPYEALYRIYHYQRERTISKYRDGIYVIPESLINDTEEMTREDRIKFTKRDNTLFIDDTDVNVNSLQALRYIGNAGAERYIDVLTNLINTIKAEAMEVADMNAQRFGDINQSAGKGTTDMAITNAQLGSILLFTLFNKFVEKDKESDIDHVKVAWINGKQGTFFDKKENKIIYVEVDGEDFFNRNIGIFVGNSAINDQKLKQFQQLAYNASQNGEFDIAADAIELESSTEIHKLIKEAVKAKQDLQRQESERQAQAQENAAKTVLQNGQEQRAADKYKVDTDNSTRIEVAQIQANVARDNSILTNSAKLESSIVKEQNELNDLTVNK